MFTSLYNTLSRFAWTREPVPAEPLPDEPPASPSEPAAVPVIPVAETKGEIETPAALPLGFVEGSNADEFDYALASPKARQALQGEGCAAQLLARHESAAEHNGAGLRKLRIDATVYTLAQLERLVLGLQRLPALEELEISLPMGIGRLALDVHLFPALDILTVHSHARVDVVGRPGLTLRGDSTAVQYEKGGNQNDSVLSDVREIAQLFSAKGRHCRSDKLRCSGHATLDQAPLLMAEAFEAMERGGLRETAAWLNLRGDMADASTSLTLRIEATGDGGKRYRIESHPKSTCMHPRVAVEDLDALRNLRAADVLHLTPKMKMGLCGSVIQPAVLLVTPEESDIAVPAAYADRLWPAPPWELCMHAISDGNLEWCERVLGETLQEAVAELSQDPKAGLRTGGATFALRNGLHAALVAGHEKVCLRVLDSILALECASSIRKTLLTFDSAAGERPIYGMPFAVGSPASAPFVSRIAAAPADTFSAAQWRELLAAEPAEDYGVPFHTAVRGFDGPKGDENGDGKAARALQGFVDDALSSPRLDKAAQRSLLTSTHRKQTAFQRAMDLDAPRPLQAGVMLRAVAKLFPQPQERAALLKELGADARALEQLEQGLMKASTLARKRKGGDGFEARLLDDVLALIREMAGPVASPSKVPSKTPPMEPSKEPSKEPAKAPVKPAKNGPEKVPESERPLKEHKSVPPPGAEAAHPAGVAPSAAVAAAAAARSSMRDSKAEPASLPPRPKAVESKSALKKAHATSASVSRASAAPKRVAKPSLPSADQVAAAADVLDWAKTRGAVPAGNGQWYYPLATRYPHFHIGSNFVTWSTGRKSHSNLIEGGRPNVARIVELRDELQAKLRTLRAASEPRHGLIRQTEAHLRLVNAMLPFDS